MPRRKKSVPSYLHHKPTNQAYVRLSDGNGGRKPVYLGTFDSPESRAEYARIVQEHLVSPTLKSGDSVIINGSDVTVYELFAAFWLHAELHYRYPDGTRTNERVNFRVAMKPVEYLYGHTLAREFGPLALKAVRAKMVANDLSRGVVNSRIRRIKHIFKWAVGEELIPASIHQSLLCVAGLQRGRTAARETVPVEPVDDAVVDATLPHLNRHVRGLVEFQRRTGCRPGEACSIRLCDLEMCESVWLYRPIQHKGIHLGKSRTIVIGPKAQALLKEFLSQDMGDYLFSPTHAARERNSERAANRKTPRYPSHMKRNQTKRKANPERAPAEKYINSSYELAVNRACDRAFPPPEPLAQRGGETHAAWWGQRKHGKWIEGRLTPAQKVEVKAWRKAHRWSPNQLRHSYATKVRKEHGLEAAQVLLGHSKADVTQIYAEKNEALAAIVATKIG